MLYNEDAVYCREIPPPINELEFPECSPIQYDESLHTEESISALESRVMWLEMDLRRDQSELRQLKFKKDELERRIEKLESTQSEEPKAPAPVDITITNEKESAPAGTSSLEFRVQRLEMDMRRYESDMRFLKMDLLALESRVLNLEDKAPKITETSASPTPTTGLYGSTEERLDDVESRLDDIESRVDDLESRY